MSRQVRKWTEEEDNLLLQQVKNHPQNLHRCFVTASSRHLSKNRKNGAGVEINRSIWQRFMQIIRNL